MKRLKQLMKKAVKSMRSPRAPENIEDTLFERDHYRDITDARLEHLQSLALPLSGKDVIDVGCGIGHFGAFFEDNGCNIFCVDGRVENITKLKELYPSRRCAVVDVESDDILAHGTFDIVFCYGLLYHLADPFGFIKNAGKICREMMILETAIMDAKDPVLRLVAEDQQAATQALHPFGCRPSASYVTTCLKLSGFEFIYQPVSRPRHPQFEYKLNNDYSYVKRGHVIRDIFVASRHEINNPMLQLVTHVPGC